MTPGQEADDDNLSCFFYLLDNNGIPAYTQRRNNVDSTLIQRLDIESTLD